MSSTTAVIGLITTLALIDTSRAGRSIRARRRAIGYVALLAWLLSLPSGAAAAPPNDNFADAAEISGLPGEATGSNVDATVEPDEPNYGERSIWFKWSAPMDGGVTVTSGGCAPPFQETIQPSYVLNVFVRSPVFGLVPVQQSFHATAGRTFWIAVGSSPGQPADPDICVRLIPGPANDEFSRATPLTGFPVSATQMRQSSEGPATQEPGEPQHDPMASSPPPGSVWFTWAAPADGQVRLRLCGDGALLAVYTGSRVDGLTWIAARRTRDRHCGSLRGASVRFDTAQGEVYRIAVTSPGESFQLLLGNQVAVLSGRTPAFLYTAFPGQVDDVKLRLTGSGEQRALLVGAGGVTEANGCQAEGAPGVLRCPIPGKAAVAVDIDLGDGNDTADVRLPDSVRVLEEEEGLVRRVLGGSGDDSLAGSAGSYTPAHRWTGRLELVGGPGADRFAGGSGNDRLSGGPGPDRIDAGRGSDSIDAGPGDDRVRTRDGASDSIACKAGRDRARLDGIDLPRKCERRLLSGPARAVATSAFASNDTGDSIEHLIISIACPIDAGRSCRSRVTPVVPGGQPVSRHLKVAAGRFSVVRFFRFSEDRLVRRGLRVTVSTLRRGETLTFADRLAVIDDRYYGE